MIISAPTNWFTARSPYRARQPSLPAKGPSVNPRGSAACRVAKAIGICDMFCTPCGDDEVLCPGQHGLRREVHGLLRGAALPVHRHPRHLLGQPRRQPAGPRDVPGLRPHGVEAAEDDVLDGGRVDPGPRDQLLQHVRAEIGRVDRAQSSPASPDGRTDRFDDVGLGHGNSLTDGGYSRTAIPSSTIDRYCRAISSGLCCPPGRYQEAATHTVSRTNR